MPETPPEGAEAPGSRPLSLWIGLYALSGFVALSLEIVWFRLLDVAVKSTAYTFGSVLAVYLLGSGLGALAGARLASRSRRPLWAFLSTQCALLALAALPLLVVVALPPQSALVDWFFRYWADYAFFPLGHDPDRTSIVRLYVVLPLALFFLPTLLMGLSFPILQRAVHDDPATSGRKVGFLQAANIAGCTAGSLLVGLLALERLGTPGTLRLLIALGLVFALVGMRYYGRGFALPALALVALAVLLPGPKALWRRLHGVEAKVPLVFFEEDATSVVALTPDEGGWRLSVNGKGNSWMPYGSGHTLLGAMPATVHEAPHDVAVVGLGSGDTAWASAWRPETRSLTVFEISAPQPRILWRLVGFVDMFDTRHLLEDPRLRIRIEDGRKALEARADTLRRDRDRRDLARDRGQRQPVLGRVLPRRGAQAASRRGDVHLGAHGARRGDVPLRVLPTCWRPTAATSSLAAPSRFRSLPKRGRARAATATPYLGAARVVELVEAVGKLRPAGPLPQVLPNRDLWPRDEYAVP